MGPPGGGEDHSSPSCGWPSRAGQDLGAQPPAAPWGPRACQTKKHTILSPGRREDTGTVPVSC
eukprot:4849416-Pyramimonas_sp.AAC.1